MFENTKEKPRRIPPDANSLCTVTHREPEHLPLCPVCIECHRSEEIISVVVHCISSLITHQERPASSDSITLRPVDLDLEYTNVML